MTVGIGGWGSRRKPMAIVRALLRSPVRNLTLVTYGGSLGKCLAAAEQLAPRANEQRWIDVSTVPKVAGASFELETLDGPGPDRARTLAVALAGALDRIARAGHDGADLLLGGGGPEPFHGLPAPPPGRWPRPRRGTPGRPLRGKVPMRM